MDFFLALFCFISICMNEVNDRENLRTVVSNTRDVIILHTDDAETERDHVLWMVGAQNIHSPEGYEWIISKFDSYSGLNNITNHSRHHMVWSFIDSGCGGQPQMLIQSRSACQQSTKADNDITVMEGEAVTLLTDVAELDHTILWLYKSKPIAEVYKQKLSILDANLKPRLYLSHTGSLTIKNTRTTDSGDYQCNFFKGDEEENKCFHVMVYDSLPVPVISRDSSQNSSSASTCVLLCSVMNVTRVSLSWYNGSRVHSSISVSDLNIRLSLPLLVEYQDTNTYRCVVNNPVTNQTTHLNITQHCQPFSGYKIDTGHIEITNTADTNTKICCSRSHYGITAAVAVPTVAVVFFVIYCLVKYCRQSVQAGRNVN